MDPVTSPGSSCWFSVINYVHPFGSSGNPCFHSQLKKRVCDNILKPWFSCLLFKTIYILWALSESLTVTLKILDLWSLLKPVVLFSGNLNLTLRAPGFISLLESVLFLLRHTLWFQIRRHDLIVMGLITEELGRETDGQTRAYLFILRKGLTWLSELVFCSWAQMIFPFQLCE